MKTYAAALFCNHNEENRSHACVSVDLTNVFRARYVCVSRLGCNHNEENQQKDRYKIQFGTTNSSKQTN